MIWTTWRQHRAEATVGAGILAALLAAMIVVGTIARDRARALGLPACTTRRGECSSALETLHRDFHQIPPFTGALIAVPLLAGMFWAGPLVSREYEAGTHRLAWTQSVSPARWIITKIVLLFTFATAAAAALGLLATWTLDPLTDAFGGRYNSTWYDVQGVVPVACMLFALSVGVAASATIRRTVPAMAVTLVAYAAVRIPIHWVRAHFAPLATFTRTVSVTSLLHHGGGQPQDLAAPDLGPSDWLQSNTVTDMAGRPVSTNGGDLGLIQHYCPNIAPTGDGNVHISIACQRTLRDASIHETARYQPASHFWIIQTVESAIFVGIAALLIVAAVLGVTRRRPT